MFLLAHLTDLHLGPLPAMRRRDFASKRLLGYINWQRNRSHGFQGDVLAALVEDMRSHKPDHVAVTGDLVNLALSAEIIAAHEWLSALGDPNDVTVVPGNHDAYVVGSLDEASRLWRKFMIGDEQQSESEAIRFPFIRKRGPVAFIGLSTAVPSLPLMATGFMTPDQLKHLGEHLDALGQEGLFRVVLIHHAPTEGSTPWQRRLIGAGLFRAEIAKHGAELVLHGHNHRTHVSAIAGKIADVPVIGGAAASVVPHAGRPGGSYNLFRIESRDGKMTCTMTERGIAAPGGKVETFSEKVLVG